MFYPLHLASMLTYDIRMCRQNVVRYGLWERFRRFWSAFSQSASGDGQQGESQNHPPASSVEGKQQGDPHDPLPTSSTDHSGQGQGEETEEQKRERLRQEELERLAEEQKKKKNGGTGGNPNDPDKQGK